MNLDFFLEENNILNFKGKNVALVMPPYGYVLDRAANPHKSKTPALGLYSIASNCKNTNVRVFDSNNYNSLKELHSDLFAFLKKGDLLGVATYTRTYPFSLEILNEFPDDYVLKVLGGPFSTHMPDLKKSHIIFRGESELSFNSFIENPWKFDISGTYFSVQDNIIDNGISIIKSLDTMSDIDYSKIDWSKYYPAATKSYTGKVGTIVSSRGCPSKCTFCDSLTRNTPSRYSSVERILENIDYFKSAGFKTIQFWDDNFLQRNNLELNTIIQALIDKNLDFTCYGRSDNLSSENIDLLVKGSCQKVFMGIESGNSKVRDFYGKRLSSSQIETSIQNLRKNGITSECGIILGSPIDTIQTIEDSKDFIKNVNPDICHASILTVHPGTPLYNYSIRKKLLSVENGLLIPNYGLYGTEEPLGFPPVSRIIIPQNPTLSELFQEKEWLKEQQSIINSR